VILLPASQLFSSGAYIEIQEKVKTLINNQDTFLTKATSDSPRAVGDAIQGIIEDNFQDILGDWCCEYTAQFPRRAMADLAFTDALGNYYVVDVKTHRMDTKFNMPNLTSVERLARFYQDDSNYFTILIVKYKVEGDLLTVVDVQFVPIEYLDWECLTIGALGWGQIQITNSNQIIVRPQTRTQWMMRFCEIMLDFYPREIKKISRRLEHFQNIYAQWRKKAE
jgi:hypothetical protein